MLFVTAVGQVRGLTCIWARMGLDWTLRGGAGREVRELADLVEGTVFAASNVRGSGMAVACGVEPP
ncbi:MAG: hypothetical protein ACI8TQ_001441 [Planctomycetota bacterium]|jgi:hypothetical protein